MTLAPDTHDTEQDRPGSADAPAPAGGVGQARPEAPPFILYLDGPMHVEALEGLSRWVRHLLLPVYGREVTSASPWCPSWWLHPDAVAQLYGLWMAWQELTVPTGGYTGPAVWHRDYLTHVMASLRDPNGPFAGCKGGAHRAKEAPEMDPFPG